VVSSNRIHDAVIFPCAGLLPATIRPDSGLFFKDQMVFNDSIVSPQLFIEGGVFLRDSQSKTGCLSVIPQARLLFAKPVALRLDGLSVVHLGSVANIASEVISWFITQKAKR
jgi:hypothetical protein